MNKFNEEIIFENEDHRKCHYTLMEILKEGTFKPNRGMIVRLTEGVSKNLLDSNCINSAWKINFISLIKKEAKQWEKDGGIVGKKLRQTLQNMVISGEQILPKWICDKAGVEQWYLSKNNLKYRWQNDLYAKVKKEQLKWEKKGGHDFKLGIEALKNVTKTGERPSVKAIVLEMGKNISYLNRKAYIWQKKLVKIIQIAEYKWKLKGGKWRKLFNNKLNEYTEKGIRPHIKIICEDLGYDSTNITNGPLIWQRIVKTNIINAEKYWLNHGGLNAIKCKKALIQIVKKGKIPTPANVAKKAGFGESFLKKDLVEWKEKILKIIESKVSKGRDKIDISYIYINSLIDKQIIEDYEKLGMIIENKKTSISNYFMLSQIMYEESHVIVKNKTTNDLYANKNTFKEKRKVYIDGIVNACEGQKYSLIINLVPRMIKIALLLGDNIPLTLNDAKKSFFEYSTFLRKKIKSSEISHSVGYHEQLAIILLLASMFNVDNDEIIKDNRSLLIPQKPPRSNAFLDDPTFSQDKLSYAFNFYFSLFNQIADFVLNEEKFPQVIQLPRGSATILGVGQNLIVPSYNLPKQQCIGIDYLDGHILDDTELKNLAKKNKIKRIYFYYQNRKITQNNLFILNNNPNHAKRLALGKKALDAWFMCMLYLTSTNDSTLSLYEWSDNDEYEMIKDERKEFITIKPRANNKTIRFTIPKVFMTYFSKALKLREFVLNGENFPYLFFQVGYGKKAGTSRSQYNGGMSSIISSSMIKSFDNNLPKITSRTIRKDGSKDAITSHGVEIALAVLQNEKNTLINNYNGFTSKELSSQISDFIEIIHETVIYNYPIENEKQTVMGGCNNEVQLIPQTITDENDIKANCDDFKSCIFCVHFLTFPSSNEIRKLLSLKYLIENVAYNRTDDDILYEEKMKPWLKRIETILNTMIEKYPESQKIINDISVEVYQDGLLSSYWLDWIIDLEELGRLS
ncbi:hypothetical protein ACOL3B_06620 [Aliarcobacter butzleri]